MLAREALLVDAPNWTLSILSNLVIHLGEENQLLARDSKLSNSSADDTLRVAAGVHIRGAVGTGVRKDNLQQSDKAHTHSQVLIPSSQAFAKWRRALS